MGRGRMADATRNRSRLDIRTGGSWGRPVIATSRVVEYQSLEKIRIETLESTFPLAITRALSG